MLFKPHQFLALADLVEIFDDDDDDDDDSFSANDEKNLRIWERKVLRKIFGPICIAGYWRSRTEEEVRQLYGELDRVTEIISRSQ